MKRAPILLALAVIACGCAGPSLRNKNDVAVLVAQQDYTAAINKLEKQKSKFGEKNAVMYYQNLGLVQHDGGMPKESNESFARVQTIMDELFTKSISKGIGQYLINDNTVPYYAPEYERALTFYFRAMDFLDQGDLQGALVEARKAVFFLDNLRESKKSGYRDDPFVQYFTSLLFESGGARSDARIARTNAFDAYDKAGYHVQKPDFSVPASAAQMGEIIFVHYNGFVPMKMSRTMQVAWNEAWLSIQGTDELQSASPSVQNAIIGGYIGNSITIAYPVLVDVPYKIVSSDVEVAGYKYETQLVSNVSAHVRQTLDEQMLAQRVRMIARAVIKQVMAVQAKHAAKSASNDDNIGMLAGALMSVFNAATEVADTRSWFLLPGEIRMSRMFVPPGVYTIIFNGKDETGANVSTKEFVNIEIKKGSRTFLHTRTAI